MHQRYQIPPGLGNGRMDHGKKRRRHHRNCGDRLEGHCFDLVFPDGKDHSSTSGSPRNNRRKHGYPSPTNFHAMSSLRLTNHFSTCRLVSLSKLKAAAEFPARDANGPYLIAQEGYDPSDPAMRRGEFLLSRSGEWLGTHWFVRLPVPERRKDFFFATVGEVMEMMQNLPSQVRVISTKPANVPEDAPPDADFDDLLDANGH